MNVEVCCVEAVAVRLKDAVLVLDEVEGEGLEGKRRAEPDEPGFARTSRSGWNAPRDALADGAVDAVGRDDQVGVAEAQPRQVRVALQVVSNRTATPSSARAFLKDVEELPARDAGKAVAARA